MEENLFCITVEPNIVCKDPVFDEFKDEREIIVRILNYFKSYLPLIMSKKIDCRGREILIDPKDIGVTVQKDIGNYIVILIPTDDNSAYNDNGFYIENSEYAFQLYLEVKERNSEGALENLIKLKSGVKTMLVNMDKNLKLNTFIENFSYEGPYSPEGTKNIIRAGTYRFSITDTKTKQNG